ncbi:MAG: hypothetical protein FWC97_11480, partial [Treponema sp.]|nr:hypothetical protein [Treponema sp.]
MTVKNLPRLMLVIFVLSSAFTAVFTGCLLGDDIDTIRARANGNNREPVIRIHTHPQPQTVFTAGNISGNLSVEATSTGTLSFQWFNNTENCNGNGTKIDGETNANFAIPQTLTAGTYYYFVEI